MLNSIPLSPANSKNVLQCAQCIARLAGWMKPKAEADTIDTAAIMQAWHAQARHAFAKHSICVSYNPSPKQPAHHTVAAQKRLLAVVLLHIKYSCQLHFVHNWQTS